MMSAEYIRLEGEDYGTYYARLLASSYRAGEALKTHETWKRRLSMGSGVRAKDCRHRIFVVLGELLKSGFLLNDYFDTGVPKDDRVRAAQELKSLGYGELLEIDGADWKYGLLSQQLRKPGEKRVLADRDKASFYIDEMHDKLSDEALECFIWFDTMTRLAYEELERLESDGGTDEEDPDSKLTPKQKALKNFVKIILSLGEAVYKEWNGKSIAPAVHQAEVEIVIKRDDLKKYMLGQMNKNSDELASWCYPETSKSRPQLCRYVRMLQDRGYFGKLPNEQIAEALAPLLKLKVGTVTNYLSQSQPL